MSKGRFIFLVVILILLQVVINGSLSVSTYFFPAPVCFLLLGMERSVTAVKCMLTAFVVGLIVDVMSFGIPGLWSASLTAAAVPRLAIIRRRAWADDSDLYDMPSLKEMGTVVYFFYALSVNLVFYAVYVAVEKMSFDLTLTDGVRILISVVTNTLCMMVMALLVRENRRN